MSEEESLVRLLLDGMIEKSRAKLEEAMSKDALLYHMTGLEENREEYIQDILDGTLNYYDYEILSFDKERAVIRLLAKVYGGGKSWWRLVMSFHFQEENRRKKIQYSRVRMG